MVSPTHLSAMRSRITDEIFLAFGLRKTGFPRRMLSWMVYPPAQRFSELFAAADEAAAREGLPGGGRSLIRDLHVQLRVRGADSIPTSGPLLVISNHPGAYDSAALSSCLPRPDLKLIVYETPFYRVLPHIGQQFFYATEDPAGRMLALRAAIRCLQEGGAILQFGTGLIDPDPASLPGAEESLRVWSPSLEIMLRKAPETQVVLAIASGVLLPRFARHPLTRLRRQPMARRRLAEFMQVMQQLVAPRSLKASACLSFSQPVSVAELSAEARSGRLMPAILARACSLLHEHRAAWNLPETFPGEKYEGY